MCCQCGKHDLVFLSQPTGVKQGYAKNYGAVSGAPGAQSGTFTSVSTEGSYANPSYSNKQCYAENYGAVSGAPGAQSGTFTSVSTGRSYANPFYRPSRDTQECSGRYSIRTDGANWHARLLVH